MSTPTPRQNPDEWAPANRTYKPNAGVPGPRDPTITPYTIAFMRAVASGLHARVVMMMFAQGGKSEALLDIIGERMANAPAPILYAGPNKQFLREQWEPRIMELLDQAPTLRAKVARGKRMTQTRKVIGGAPLRLAHARSSTALKSDPAALALTDEADELVANVKGQGDPVGLIDRRGETYADFVHAIVSTPSQGPSEVEHDDDSGLDFWAMQDPEDVDSKIWNLWQTGTRYHWAWRCPECREYFIPRFSCLDMGGDPRKISPRHARENARLICPRNGCVIRDDPEDENLKAAMNAGGVYVAPGQRVTRSGKVVGDPPDSTTVSFWVSGLASPFVTWGERAESYVTALASGDQEEVKTVINGGFGELWSPTGGDVPEWEEVRRCALPYLAGELPDGVQMLTAGVDVQKNRLVYVIRGWGPRWESWLISAGELWGPTDEDDVWADLSAVLEAPIEGMHIKRAFIDAGFRPGKKDAVPEHKVYEFCRTNSRLCYATKGFLTRPTPLTANRIDVTVRGRKAKVGLDLLRLDVNFFKSWVHARVRWPVDAPGGWHLYQDITEDYCRQIVSEARVKKPGGGFAWVEKSRNNHFLDCEALAYAAAYMAGVNKIDRRARRQEQREARQVAVERPPVPRDPRRPVPDEPPAVTPPAPRQEPPAPPAPRKPPRRSFVSSYF